MTEGELLLLHAATSGMGMYPSARIDADGTRHERTQWEEGWNAACSKLTDDWLTMDIWLDSLQADSRAQVVELLRADVLSVRVDNDVVTIWLVMNDTFDYACADGEYIPIDQLPTVLRMWVEYGHDGLTAWAARQRGEQPLRELLTDKYASAVATL
jgi:hypothetical protein